MNFWDRINLTDTAGAAARGFEAFAAGQRAAMQGAHNIDWSVQRPLRDLLLKAREEDAATDLQLGRQVNNALGIIAESRPDLYNSNTGYMTALNAIAPLQEGQSRVLSEDGKTINILGPNGQVMDSTPNLRGKAAENALLDMSGLNLRQRARTLPQENQFEAQLNAQLARLAAEQQYKTALLQAGLRGGRGLGGSSGSSGDGLGRFPKPSDWASMMPWLAPAYFGAAGIPLTQNGMPDFATMDPTQIQLYQQLMGQMLQDFGVGAIQGLPALAAGINAYGLNTRRGLAAAQAAANQARWNDALNKSRQAFQHGLSWAHSREQLNDAVRNRTGVRDPLGLGY